MAASDGIDVLVYFFGFWMFMFSPKFRQACIAEWKDGNTLQRIVQVLEACFSFLAGVAVPAALIIWLLL